MKIKYLFHKLINWSLIVCTNPTCSSYTNKTNCEKDGAFKMNVWFCNTCLDKKNTPVKDSLYILNIWNDDTFKSSQKIDTWDELVKYIQEKYKVTVKKLDTEYSVNKGKITLEIVNFFGDEYGK